MSSKKMPASTMLALAITAASVIGSWYVMKADIDNIKQRITKTEKAIENLHKVNDRLIRIEVLTESVLSSNLKLTESVAIVSTQVQQGAFMINESYEHSKNAAIHANR